MLKQRRDEDEEELPLLTPSTTHDLKTAELGRRHLFKQINLKLNKLSDPTLDAFQLKRLNDDMNVLIQVKREWDLRIRQLKGFKGKVDPMWEDLDAQGALVDGYYYFGRAKEELLREKKKAESKVEERDLRKELLSRVDATYFAPEEVDEDLKPLDFNLLDPNRPALKTQTQENESEDYLPSEKEIQAWILEKKRQQLLAKLK